MLAIRLNRTGKRNRAHFRVVVQEHTKAPGKRHVEIVGSYDPHKKTTILNKDRILYWISQGAQVSDAVHNMLVREGIVTGKKIAKKMPKPVVKEAPAAEAPAETVSEVKPEETTVAAPEAVVEASTEEAPVVTEVAAETAPTVPDIAKTEEAEKA
ncbi:MAG: 30S ribosomal protein S16 [Candidatus Moranbacteria bacterium]|nr:30S ribosomal protein S16 [Candidatus Moranbacteria bacterium]